MYVIEHYQPIYSRAGSSGYGVSDKRMPIAMNEPNNMVIDKSVRSVFVGNIPYEATEEKLKDIFAEVGPVVSFKLVFDRETGKPKGWRNLVN